MFSKQTTSAPVHTARRPDLVCAVRSAAVSPIKSTCTVTAEPLYVFDPFTSVGHSSSDNIKENASNPEKFEE